MKISLKTIGKFSAVIIYFACCFFFIPILFLFGIVLKVLCLYDAYTFVKMQVLKSTATCEKLGNKAIDSIIEDIEKRIKDLECKEECNENLKEEYKAEIKELKKHKEDFENKRF